MCMYMFGPLVFFFLLQKKFRRVRTLDSDGEEEEDQDDSEKRSIATRVRKELEEASC